MRCINRVQRYTFPSNPHRGRAHQLHHTEPGVDLPPGQLHRHTPQSTLVGGGPRTPSKTRNTRIPQTWYSVPARHISEGAAPCLYCLAPCPNLKKKKWNLIFFLLNVIAVFVFSQGCKNACKMLADLCPCFHRSPTKLCPDLVSFMCWIATEFWSFAL